MLARRTPRGGFTLFEVLGVILITGFTIGFATNFYIDLSRASNRASKNTREIRLGTSIIDRIARDFERALLVDKPDEVDPIGHPWLFIGETREAEEGSDLLKFVTRNYQPRRLGEHESDLAVVAYIVAPSEDDDSLELYRWSHPRLPESLDRSFPDPDDEGSVLLADGLASFSVTFYDESGEASSNWDSTTLVDSSSLPEAVEIAVSFAGPEGSVGDPDARTTYRRSVRLPMRPLDLELLLDPEYYRGGQPGDLEDGDGDDDGDGVPNSEDPDYSGLKVRDCLDIDGWIQARDAFNTVPEWAQRVDESRNQPWEATKSMFPPEFFAFYSTGRAGCK